jgi:hypothetical protein
MSNAVFSGAGPQCLDQAYDLSGVRCNTQLGFALDHVAAQEKHEAM